MRAVVVWWDLTDSKQTIESLRTFLRDEAVDRYAQVRGLILKFWISDEATNRWGAVFLWESAESASQPLPTRAAELIGYRPAVRFQFDVEAATYGLPEVAELAGRGLSFS